MTVPSRASLSVQSFGICYRNPGLLDAVVIRTAAPERSQGAAFLVEIVNGYLICGNPAGPVGSKTCSDEAYDAQLARHCDARSWDNAADAESAARDDASIAHQVPIRAGARLMAGEASVGEASAGYATGTERDGAAPGTDRVPRLGEPLVFARNTRTGRVHILPAPGDPAEARQVSIAEWLADLARSRPMLCGTMLTVGPDVEWPAVHTAGDSFTDDACARQVRADPR